MSAPPSSLPNNAATLEEPLEAPPQLPVGDRGYYACRTCRRILTEPQWYREGCLDCRTGPIMRGELTEYATTHFANFIGLIDPERSWVARLIQKRNAQTNGVFAEALSDEDSDQGDDEEEEAYAEGEDAEDAEDAGEAVPPTPPQGTKPMTDEELLGLF